MATLKDRCTCADLCIDGGDGEVAEPHVWPQTPLSPWECQNERPQMFGREPFPGPPEPVSRMNANAQEFVPQAHSLPGQLPPPQLQHMRDGSLNMAVQPVLPMPQAHLQRMANCIPLAPQNLPVPPPPQHAAPLTAQFGLPTLLRSQPQMHRNMEMQKFLPAPPKPPSPPTQEPQNVPVLRKEEPKLPTREECIKMAEEVLEEQRIFLGQLGIMPLKEARLLWTDAMMNALKGPGPIGPGLEDLRVRVPPPDELPEHADEPIDMGPVALPMAESLKLAHKGDEGALVVVSPKPEGDTDGKAMGAEGTKSSSAPTSPGKKGNQKKAPTSPGQKGSPKKAKPAASQEWAPHLHAPSRPWPYSPGVISKGDKRTKGASGKGGTGGKGCTAGKNGKNGKNGKGGGKGGNGKGKSGGAFYARPDGKVWTVKKDAAETAPMEEQTGTNRRPRCRGKMSLYATGN